MSFERRPSNERWNRLESIRLGLAALRQSFPPLAERHQDDQGFLRDFDRKVEWSRDREERLENIQRKLSSARQLGNQQDCGATGQVASSSSLYDTDALASNLGLGNDTANAWFEQYQPPDPPDPADGFAESQVFEPFVSWDAPVAPLSRTLYDSPPAVPPREPCPSPPTPPPAPPELPCEQSFQRSTQELGTCSASHLAAQLLRRPERSEPTQEPRPNWFHQSMDDQSSPDLEAASSSRAPRPDISASNAMPTSPVQPPFRCGLGPSNSRKRPCSAGRLRGRHSPFVAAPEELRLSGQAVGHQPGPGGSQDEKDAGDAATESSGAALPSRFVNRPATQPPCAERGESLSSLLGRKCNKEPSALSTKEMPAENLWHSIELKVFLRRADLEDLFGLLREEYSDLSVARLLAIPDEELWQLKARRLSVKRLVEAVTTERRRRFSVPGDWTSSASPHVTPRPRTEVKPAVANLAKSSDAPCASRHESASKMVARLLPSPEPTVAPEASQTPASAMPSAPAPPKAPAEAQVTHRPSTAAREAKDGSVACGSNHLNGGQGPTHLQRSSAEQISMIGPLNTTLPQSSNHLVEDGPWRSTATPRRFRNSEASTPRTETPRSRQKEDGREGDASCRPQTRRARIRELLKRLNLAQTPCMADVVRVDARQRQAKERHLRLAGSSSTPSTGALSPALSLRRSRSFMDLIVTGDMTSSASRTSPVDPRMVEDVISRLPAKVATASREPCTICLEVPTSGEMVTTLPCCHWYHTECIREWLLHARLCPLCKALVAPEELGI